MEKRPILAVDKISMKVVDEFDNAYDCAFKTSTNIRVVRMSLDNGSIPSGKLIFRYKDSFDPKESFEGKRNRPVRIIDTVTGRRYAAYDATQVAKELGLSYTYVRRAMRDNILVRDRLRFEQLR